jgi:hypothetical protein
MLVLTDGYTVVIIQKIVFPRSDTATCKGSPQSRLVSARATGSQAVLRIPTRRTDNKAVKTFVEMQFVVVTLCKYRMFGRVS